MNSNHNHIHEGAGTFGAVKRAGRDSARPDEIWTLDPSTFICRTAPTRRNPVGIETSAQTVTVVDEWKHPADVRVTWTWTPTAEHVSTRLLEAFSLWGTPEWIIIDRGSVFDDERVRDLCAAVGTAVWIATDVGWLTPPC